MPVEMLALTEAAACYVEEEDAHADCDRIVPDDGDRQSLSNVK